VNDPQPNPDSPAQPPGPPAAPAAAGPAGSAPPGAAPGHPPGHPQGHPSAPPIRRLAAILIADVSGYSRMMERDEEGTHARLREVRAQVTDPAIARRGGRIVRTAGDGMLVEFASAVEALSCAVEIQREMAARNRGLAVDSRIDYRIGINLGDIIFDGADIAGDGVNLAARLESLAEPGGIALSRQVREAVRQVVGVTLNDAGLHRVKNITEPVRVFTVSLEGNESPRHGPRLALRFARPRLAATLALLVAAAVGAAYLTLRAPPEAPAQSLAVLPFQNLSGRADAAPLAERLTAEVTNAMSRVSGFVVAARATTTRFAGPHDPRSVGRQLGVRYVLEGTLTGAGDRVRITAQLVRTDTGAQLWGDTLDVQRDSGAAAHDIPVELIGRLSDVVRAQVRTAELRRVQASGEPGDAYGLSLLARARLPATETMDDVRAVRALYERAAALDPKHAPALAGLAYVLAVEADRSFDVAERDRLLRRADEISLQAVTLDGNDAEAWGTRSSVLQYQARADAAREAIDRALALNPYFNELHAQRGGLLLNAGRAEEAIAALDHAIRLNPVADTVGVQLNLRCRALLYLADYAGAIESCERATTSAPDWPDYMLLAAAYALRGDRPRAVAARDAMLRLEPRVTIRWLRQNSGQLAPRAEQQREKQLYAGLRLVGVPD
jgi:class 3 adenylate cyclase/TolB-like protein/Tfp pilus assembly protein PilF